MNTSQLIGRYLRLRDELIEAFRARPLQREHAARLAADLTEARAALVRSGMVEEQTEDGFAPASSAFLLPPSEFGEDHEWLGTL